MTVRLENRLFHRKKLGNIRKLQPPLQLIDFSSNDYLGLAKSSHARTRLLEEWNMHESDLNGLGSTGSRLLTGNSTYAEELEKSIATFHGFEAGLLFNCGYMANVGLLSTIADYKDTVFFDSRVHASTHDGIRLSRAQAFPFKHNDLEHLENRLKTIPTKGDRFICIESLYSTDGTKAPLSEICQLAKKYDAHLIVDEAHAVGVCGPNGKGLVAEQNLHSCVFAQVTTFGKALGTHGAIVLGNHSLKHGLINFASSYIYTTALPFLSLAAIKCSYDLLPQLESERSHLRKLRTIFHKAYPHSSETHIQSVKITGNQAVRHIAQKLIEKGFDVRPLMSPTVQRGDERLRICLHAFNTEDEVTTLLENIESSRGTAS